MEIDAIKRGRTRPKYGFDGSVIQQKIGPIDRLHALLRHKQIWFLPIILSFANISLINQRLRIFYALIIQ